MLQKSGETAWIVADAGPSQRSEPSDTRWAHSARAVLLVLL